jgi:hypothetical protein
MGKVTYKDLNTFEMKKNNENEKKNYIEKNEENTKVYNLKWHRG